MKYLCHFARPFDFLDFVREEPSILREVLGCKAPLMIDTYSLDKSPLGRRHGSEAGTSTVSHNIVWSFTGSVQAGV
jgi:hypothetical protein